MLELSWLPMNGALHICMVTVQHASKDDRIYFKQAMSLRNAGYEVSILTANEIGVAMDMSGHAFPEGKDEHGINHLCVSEPEGFIQRSLKKAFRGKFYKDMIAAASSTGASIFVAHEAQSITIARKAAEKNKGLYVFDAHESIHVENPKERLALKTEIHALQYLTCANSITLETLLDKASIKISEVIYNASLIPASAVNDSQSPVIVHEGSLPFNRGLKLMMEAMVILKELEPAFKLKIVGTVKGEEKEYFESMVLAHGLEEHIQISGWIEYEKLASALEEGSIGLILNTPEPNNLYGGPANKLFNYIASNMAVVAVDLPETTRILQETKAGITLLERAPRLLAETLARLISDEKQLSELRYKAHQAHKRLSWSQEEKKLVKFYSRLEGELSQ